MSRLFTAIAVLLTLATVAGLAILWPGHPKLKLAGGIAVDSQNAKVAEVKGKRPERLAVGEPGHAH